MSTNFFPEGRALVHHLFKGTNGGLGSMFDLANIPPRQMEIERKYRITGEDTIAHRMTLLISRFGSLLREHELAVRRFQPFIGLDQYWVLQHPHGKITFRYRFSANVLPELTVKVQLTNGQNEQRAEFNLDMRDADVQNVRAFMSVVCTFAEHKHFCVHQSGNFWTLLDKKGRRLELVLYKVGRFGGEADDVFCEIEARNFEKPEDAIQSIVDIEKVLELAEKRCEQTVAEMYG